MHIIAVNGRLQLLFKNFLHSAVQGQNHIRPPLSGLETLIRKGHIHFVIALGGNHLAQLPGEIAVIGRFDSLGAIVGGIGKADDLGGQTPSGVDPHGGRFQMNAGNSLRIQIGAYLRRFLLGNIGSHLLVSFFQVTCLRFNPGSIPLEDFPQAGTKAGDIRPGLPQLMGIQIDIFPVFGDCQHIEIPVIDCPPIGSNGGGAALVAQGEGTVLLVLPHHQRQQPPQQRKKRCNAQHQRREHHPPVLAAVHPQPSKLLSHTPTVPFG